MAHPIEEAVGDQAMDSVIPLLEHHNSTTTLAGEVEVVEVVGEEAIQGAVVDHILKTTTLGLQLLMATCLLQLRPN